MPDGPVLTRDEVLLWLNDRLGRHVYVTVAVDLGDRKVEVLSTGGTLRHEVTEGLSIGEMGRSADPAMPLVGWYSIGDYEEDEEGTHLDLTALEHVRATVVGEWLQVEVREGIRIGIEVASASQ